MLGVKNCLLVTGLSLRGYLRVLHHALDAVKVGEVADGLVGIVQHPSDSLEGPESRNAGVTFKCNITAEISIQSRLLQTHDSHYHLQLSQRVVTLLLTRSLLSTQGDQLINAVSHRPETRKRRGKTAP